MAHRQGSYNPALPKRIFRDNSDNGFLQRCEAPRNRRPACLCGSRRRRLKDNRRNCEITYLSALRQHTFRQFAVRFRAPAHMSVPEKALKNIRRIYL